MSYKIDDLPLTTLLPALSRAEDQLARLDEIVRRSPVGEGYAERAHFSEAAASMWVAGELVHIEDLVLHDANMDVRTPTHETTIAHSILWSRRSITEQESVWAITKAGIEHLIGRRSSPMHRTGAGEGDQSLTLSSPRADIDDGFATEMAEIDAVLARSTRTLLRIDEERKSDPVAVGELFIHDPDWDEDDRLSNWRSSLQEVEALPATLAAAILWDAWETLEPLQRQHWLGGQLVSSYLRSRGKVTSHLFCLNVGLKSIPREMRRSRNRTSRLVAGLVAMAAAAEIGIKEVIRLGQAREQLQRKLRNKRSSSSLPGLVDLLITRPVVSSSMIVESLKVSHRGALNLVTELGVRELTGRGSYRVWGIL
ncbi:RHE_PE00001 family protein [Rhizobium binae]|uniref:RHE_PE00001 family protein n=1 Tax=Rhizobium binae TaxID=1138190 RepID=UPI001C82E577|nr:RHE_PE00001 family protein [Rhizobium binae]MBX4962685.1 DUF1612 and helix-turn-helix domain-containing protein [Rhizobium binae]